jgi:hypothetical protein
MAAAMSPRELAALLLGPSKGAKRLTPEALAVLSGNFVLKVPTWALSNITPAEGHTAVPAAATGTDSEDAAGVPQQQQAAENAALPGLFRRASISMLPLFGQSQRGYMTTIQLHQDAEVLQEQQEDGATASAGASTSAPVMQGKGGSKGGSKGGNNARNQEEWELHKAMARRLAEDFLALANSRKNWTYGGCLMYETLDVLHA